MNIELFETKLICLESQLLKKDVLDDVECVFFSPWPNLLLKAGDLGLHSGLLWQGVNVEKKIGQKNQRTSVLIYNAQKLPCGSSNFSGKLSLYDSFSIGLIMLSSKEKADGKKE